MPGAKEKETKAKEPIENNDKGFFQKLKEILKKGLDLAKNAVVGGAGIAVDTATAVGVRILGGQKGYNKWLESKATEADIAEIKAANEKMIGSKVVYNTGKFHLEGEIEKFTKTKDGDMYQVKLCDGNVVNLTSDQFISRETFDRQNRRLDDEYKMKFFDKAAWDRYHAAGEYSEKQNQSEQSDKEADKDKSKNDIDNQKAKDENSKEKSSATEKPKENIDLSENQKQNGKKEINEDLDLSPDTSNESPTDTIENVMKEAEEQQKTSEREQNQTTSEPEFYYFEDNSVIITDEDEKETKAYEEQENEEQEIDDTSMNEKNTVHIPNKIDDMEVGDHVLYSYKGKYQEATITAINKKSIDIEMNDGRKGQIKNAEIGKSLFGLEDIKDNKVMVQCVTDEKNTKFSSEFRDAYNEPDKDEIVFDSIDNNFDELDLDISDDTDMSEERDMLDIPESLEEQMKDARNEVGYNGSEDKNIDEHKQGEMSFEM